MAADQATLNAGGLVAPGKSLMGGKLIVGIGAAAVIAFMAVVWLWSQQPDYRVLFSNFSDKDGGAVVAALEQMNIPYKFSEGGSAILVPSQHVHGLYNMQGNHLL